MPIELYYFPESAPCRAVIMAAKCIGVDMDLKLTSVKGGDNRTLEFLQMNPQHTLPTLDDNGFYLNESRAMIQYLANAYGKNDRLYPKEPKARARIDMKLYFEMEMWARFLNAFILPFFTKSPPTPSAMPRFEESLQFTEAYLQEGYIAGSWMTIADISLTASLSTIEAIGHDLTKFPRVQEYMKKMKEEIQDYHEINDEGLEKCRVIFGGLKASSNN